MAAPPSKPTSNWLVLGGCGFLGRNFVKYLLDNALAGDVRVADKRHPAMAALSAEHKAALLDEKVEFLMSDLSADEFVEQAFSASRSGAPWDFVINLVAETGHGKKEEFYAKGVEAAEKCAAAAARAGVKKFIQLSTASVYKSEKHGAAGAEEGAAVAPWNEPAVYAARAEAAALAGAGAALPVIILRPALVYGPGDTSGLMTRAVVASTFKAEKAKMEFLWDGSLKLSTVHVFDVARAIYFAARKAAHGAGEEVLSLCAAPEPARLPPHPFPCPSFFFLCSVQPGRQGRQRPGQGGGGNLCRAGRGDELQGGHDEQRSGHGHGPGQDCGRL